MVCSCIPTPRERERRRSGGGGRDREVVRERSDLPPPPVLTDPHARRITSYLDVDAPKVSRLPCFSWRTCGCVHYRTITCVTDVCFFTHSLTHSLTHCSLTVHSLTHSCSLHLNPIPQQAVSELSIDYGVALLRPVKRRKSLTAKKAETGTGTGAEAEAAK